MKFTGLRIYTYQIGRSRGATTGMARWQWYWQEWLASIALHRMYRCTTLALLLCQQQHSIVMQSIFTKCGLDFLLKIAYLTLANLQHILQVSNSFNFFLSLFLTNLYFVVVHSVVTYEIKIFQS